MKSEVRRLPEAFLERLKQILPTGKFDLIANTFAESKPTTFRVNTLKTNRDTAREKLRAGGFRCENVSWYPAAFILREGRLRDLQQTEMYRKGEIYVQALSSMVPVLVLDPQPGEMILDLTAAPGSKTTQIACFMKNEGRLVANDNNRVRFFKLKANVEMQGARNVELSLKYGEAIGRQFPNSFDRVLLDAPCSAEGRFDIREPKSFGFWKPGKTEEMARKQKKLFYSAVEALKSGGILVYSTCTYAPEENESVLAWALQKFKDILSLEPVTLPFSNQMRGLLSWRKEIFSPAVKNAVRILPTADMEGFFVAKLKKK